MAHTAPPTIEAISSVTMPALTAVRRGYAASVRLPTATSRRLPKRRVSRPKGREASSMIVKCTAFSRLMAASSIRASFTQKREKSGPGRNWAK